MTHSKPLSPHKSQHGSVLVISMMLLLVLTILGLAAMTSSGMEARMAHNFLQSNITFQAAESSIARILVAGTPLQNPLYVKASDYLIIAMNKGINDTTTNPAFGDAELDPNNSLHDASIITNNSVVYMKAGNCLGSSMDQFVCHEFEITSDANINETRATATHTQGISRKAPKPTS